ncbi:MAG: hypothetical protein V1897_12480 [Pseudomonadota bacterium]
MDNITRGSPIVFTAFHSNGPLSKKFILNPEGKLQKINLAQLSEGTFRKIEVETLSQFSEFLSTLTPNDALAYGLFEGLDSGTVVSEGMKEKEPEKYASAKTRTKKDMGWSSGGGIMFLDYDPSASGSPLTEEELITKIREACPFLSDVEMLWRPSASSQIVNVSAGETLRGIMGQRLYIHISNAAAIPHIGKIITERLWLAGYGRFDISKCGSLLERTIVDTSVWQPERLDFAGGAVVVEPLAQERLVGKLIAGTKKFLDCEIVKPLEDNERSQLETVKINARLEASPNSRKVKAEFVEQRTKEIAGEDAEHPVLEKVRRTVIAALEGGVLYGDFVLLHSSRAKVTVNEILGDLKKWHGERFADPMEWDYANDHRIARADTMSGRPFIFSHAHGGRRFSLKKASAVLRVEAGSKAYLIDRIIQVLLDQDDLFEDGNQETMFRITGEERFPVGASWLQDKISRLISFEKYDFRTKKMVPIDIQKAISETILAKNGERGFPELKALSTAPTITPDGRIINKPGYDSGTHILFLASEVWPEIAINPSIAEIKAAFDRLWKPFKDFPFADDVTRGVMLAAIITAVMRPCLPTAPAFGLDAPTAGSGKTLLARCLGILATGHEPDISPPFENETETKKKLFADLVKGAGAVIIDNLVGKITSPTFAAILTSERYSDRLLNFSQNCTVSNRALWILTGNNLRPVGDLNRRILIARIDPVMEAKKVWKREFSLDPADYCLRHRLELVKDVLIIMKGFFMAGKPKVIPGRFASYDIWSDTVRQAVAWLGALKIAPVADPLVVLDRQADIDPEAAKLSMLLSAWYGLVGGKSMSVSKAVRFVDEIENVPISQFHLKAASEAVVARNACKYTLKEAMAEVASDSKGAVISRMLGGWIEARVGKIVNGLCFARAEKTTDGVAWWYVRKQG